MSDDLTLLLRRMSAGDATASEHAWSAVFEQLRHIAQRQMGGRAPRGSLQPTLLVNEAWLKLAHKDLSYTDRRHFYCLASKVMRAVLIDAERQRRATKRGGDLQRVSWNVDLAASQPDEGIDILALDETLQRLSQHSERMGRLVELRVFGGLSHAECAEALDCSLRLVEREWQFAKAWLYDELTR
ncbi:MAG: ECF-type sigma factor [Planctomycetota bacterium]